MPLQRNSSTKFFVIDSVLFQKRVQRYTKKTTYASFIAIFLNLRRFGAFPLEKEKRKRKEPKE